MNTSTVQNAHESAAKTVTQVHHFLGFVKWFTSGRKKHRKENFTENMAAHAIA